MQSRNAGDCVEGGDRPLAEQTQPGFPKDFNEAIPTAKRRRRRDPSTPASQIPDTNLAMITMVITCMVPWHATA